MTSEPRSFSPATCLACRQPFSAQLAIACSVDRDPDDVREQSLWRRLRSRFVQAPAPPNPSEQRTG